MALGRTDVSEELSASFIRVTRIGELGTTLAVTSNRRTLRRNKSHTVTSQKTPYFIVTAVKTSNLNGPSLYYVLKFYISLYIKIIIRMGEITVAEWQALTSESIHSAGRRCSNKSLCRQLSFSRKISIDRSIPKDLVLYLALCWT
jgi:hypothetical protein